MKQPSESEVRALRNAVYGKPISNSAWECIKNIWMKPEEIQWLRDRCDKKKPCSPYPTPTSRSS